jgi:diguanylate cyclase (GGDEF)-like protein
VIRIGGDEFAAVMKNIPAKQAAMEKAGEVLDLFNSINAMEGARAKISCSVGIAFYPKDGKSFAHLYEKADIALYTAKQRGKERYVVYDESQKM